MDHYYFHSTFFSGSQRMFFREHAQIRLALSLPVASWRASVYWNQSDWVELFKPTGPHHHWCWLLINQFCIWMTGLLAIILHVLHDQQHTLYYERKERKSSVEFQRKCPGVTCLYRRYTEGRCCPVEFSAPAVSLSALLRAALGLPTYNTLFFLYYY